VENLLPPGAVEPVVFARMTGIPLRRLRHYDRRGIFRAAVVDPVTSRRRYEPGQVGPGRLLQALHSTGMPIEEAALVVGEGRRAAALMHLAAVREALATAAEHLPPPGPDEVRRASLVGLPALVREVAAGTSAAEAVREARAALARAAGCQPGALPRFGDGEPEEVLDGPVVELSYELVPQRVLLPWHGPAPEGWEVTETERGSAAVADLLPALDELEPEALRTAEQLVGAWLGGREGGIPVAQHLALDAAAVRASLVVRYLPHDRGWWS